MIVPFPSRSTATRFSGKGAIRAWCSYRLGDANTPFKACPRHVSAFHASRTSDSPSASSGVSRVSEGRLVVVWRMAIMHENQSTDRSVAGRSLSGGTNIGLSCS